MVMVYGLLLLLLLIAVTFFTPMMSRNSRHSSRPSTSSKSSTSIFGQMAKAKARKAMLEVELQMDEQRRKLEIEEVKVKKEFEQRRRTMNLQIEIAKANAEDKVLYDEIAHSFGSELDPDDPPDDNQVPAFDQSQHDASINEWVNRSHMETLRNLSSPALIQEKHYRPVVTDHLSELETVRARLLPKLENSSFHPDPPILEYNPAKYSPESESSASAAGKRTVSTSVQTEASTPLVNTPVSVNSNVKSPESNALCDVVKELRKPTAEIEKFSGDPLQFKKFMRQFTTRVLVNAANSDEKVNFLEQYTVGKPHQIVTGFSCLDAAEAYSTAMEELNTRYGEPEIIATAYVKRALEWQNIKGDDYKALDDFSIFLVECANAVKSIKSVDILEYTENIKRLAMKLPFHLQEKWRTIVIDLKEKSRKIGFSDLVQFVKREAKKQNDPSFGRAAMGTPKKPVDNGFKTRPSAATQEAPASIQSSTSKRDKCEYCSIDGHVIQVCRKFKNIPLDVRFEFVCKNNLCFGCLKPNHVLRRCLSKKKCPDCFKFHHSSLHGEIKSPNSATDDQKSVDRVGAASGQVSAACSAKFIEEDSFSEAGDDSVCTMSILPVKVRHRNSHFVVTTYAFLDPGSSVSFCKNDVIQKLCVKGKASKLPVDTINGSSMLDCQILNGLEVMDLNEKHCIPLNKVYSRNDLPVSQVHIPRNNDLASWPHLSHITLPEVECDIGLLIGNRVSDCYRPYEIIPGPRNSPFATRTLLGWNIWSLVRDSSCGVSEFQNAIVNRIDIAKYEELDNILNLHELVKQSINLEFPERKIDDKKEHSQEDKRFLKMTNESIEFKKGHYTVNLPFRDTLIKFPNNKEDVLKRLWGIKNRMSKDPKFKEHYIAFMDSLVKNGHAEKVPEAEIDREDGKVWYIPHFGVYSPKKPDKVRVVFDCAAKFHGTSLNDRLIPGPDLTNNLVGVLTRFRQGQIGVMADIENMFYQVNVPPADRDCLRFFWFPDNDITKFPEVFRMTVHLFGACSSPSCSNLSLLQTAEDNRIQVSPEVVKLVKRNFYVDDGLMPMDQCEDTAIKLAHDVKNLCASGGFNLTKWVSNSRRVIESFPVMDRAKTVKNLDFQSESLQKETALGVTWDTVLDSFTFSVNLKDKPHTRRGILSTVSSVYDPLGMAAPVILSAKMLLQEMCKENSEWDTAVNGLIAERWKKLLSELPLLQNVKLKRCFKDPSLAAIKTCQLHHFSDGSEEGYGMVTYIRFEDINSNIHCSFVIAKARVAPLKKTTIPRLELSAATISVRMNQLLLEELDYKVDDSFFWTDSTIILQYIANESKRFLTFVANRVATIREGSDVKDWRFIDGVQNPGDEASRGRTVSQFLEKEWLLGPEFLWKSSKEWPTQPNITPIHEDDPELKKCVNVSVVSNTFLDKLIEKFSSWSLLKAVTAWYLVLFKNLLAAVRSNQSLQSCQTKKSHLTLHDLMNAEEFIIQYVQRQYFQNEITSLTNSGVVHKSSSLKGLNPQFINGLLRVGGRLSNSSLSYDAAHQIILPRDSKVSKLILLHIHKTNGHTGRNMVLSKLRERFWIPSAISLIRMIVSKCVTCRHYEGKTLEQQMSPLPLDRLVPDEPPFTRSGVDYFGPFIVKRGRASVKRYGVVFTCFNVRAVHIEIAHSLNTDSCLNAVFRFQARRGTCRILWSDNGTNLIGCRNELRSLIDTWNQEKIVAALKQKHIEWKLNPPGASHFSGVWERQIRTIRKVMFGVLGEQSIHLDDEGLQTLFCEVESIINSRPLTTISDDPNDLHPITPNDLLLLKPPESFPPGVFDPSDMYCRRRYRQCQYLADIFWKRWVKEYLPALQLRQKWLYPKRNIRKDDIVLIIDSKTDRKSWLLGRVIEVYYGRDGQARSARIETKDSSFLRPITKLSLLVETGN